ncbi:MAG TPA: hypothetical protein PLC54_06150, partial [Spirochaetales bacterium]|nr:hypothetical protein [Spirochaetales bacterium]
MSDVSPLAPAASSRYREAARRLALSAGLSVLMVGLLAVIASNQPIATMRAFFVTPFQSSHVLFSMLEASAPLMLCALGALVAFRSGHFSLGGKGQLYTGIMAAAWAGSVLPGGGLGMLVAMLAAMAGGMLIALPVAIGKRLWQADVLLLSFLVSQGSLHAVDWAIAGPLRDTSNNLVAMKTLPAATLLPRLFPPSVLSAALFFALFVSLALWLFLSKTRTGTALCLYGKNPVFASLMAFPVRAFAFWPILAGGALHGLAASFMVLGPAGTAFRGASSGLGWSAIGVSLIAGNEPLAVPLAAILFAWLDSGARQAAIWSDLPPDAAMLIKAAVL